MNRKETVKWPNNKSLKKRNSKQMLDQVLTLMLLKETALGPHTRGFSVNYIKSHKITSQYEDIEIIYQKSI